MPTIPDSMHGTPWSEEGNIIILSGDRATAFKSHAGLLRPNCSWFAERLHEISDDSDEVFDNCPIIPMKEGDSTQDLSYFLQAMHHGVMNTSLDSSDDLDSLTGILRLATKYGAPTLRARALCIFQARYPPTLREFDCVTDSLPPWSPDPIDIINLAREVSALVLLPAAMAVLTNGTSAGEAFGVQLHPTTPVRVPPHPLKATDAPAFSMVKELHQRSIIALLKFIRGVAANCRQPPETGALCTRRAPVGYISLSGTPSVCAKTLKEMADDFATMLSSSENPIGYLDFVVGVRRVTIGKNKICQRCRRNFEEGLEKKRLTWWNTLPLALGFSGWEDVQAA